jgi:hypothetical protein
MPRQQHEELQIAHQEARLAISLDDESLSTLFVGVVFHVLTTNTSKTYQEVVSTCHQVFKDPLRRVCLALLDATF